MAKLLVKKQLLLEDVLGNFMIVCTNKDLSRKTMKQYENTLKLFLKFLEEDYGITELKKVEEKHIKEYLDFTKSRGKYSFVADESKVDINRPHNRSDFGKELSTGTLNNYLRTIKVFFNFCFESNYIQINPVNRLRQYKTTRRPKEEITDVEYYEDKFNECDCEVLDIELETGI